jgi:hypothetical protein
MVFISSCAMLSDAATLVGDEIKACRTVSCSFGHVGYKRESTRAGMSLANLDTFEIIQRGKGKNIG